MTFVKLIWSTRAINEYEKLVEYLLSEWGEMVLRRASGDIDRNVNRIQNNPEQFPIFIKEKKIKKCVVLPYTTIFFKEESDTITILSLFDPRQNPQKQKLG